MNSVFHGFWKKSNIIESNVVSSFIILMIILLTYQCRQVMRIQFNFFSLQFIILSSIEIDYYYFYQHGFRGGQCLTKSIPHSLKQSPTYAMRSAHVLCRHVLFIAFDCKIIGEDFSVDTSICLVLFAFISSIQMNLLVLRSLLIRWNFTYFTS